MIDSPSETTHVDVELKNSELFSNTLRIFDNKVNSDPQQRRNLEQRLKHDDVPAHMERVHTFLGRYAVHTPAELQINIVNGAVGEGTVRDASIEVQLPDDETATSQIRRFLEPYLKEKPDQEINRISLDVAYALVASTILHEGVHGMLDSKPTSPFAADFERVTGVTNEYGTFTTLLDEGIAYGLQTIYSPSIEGIGSLTPMARSEDPPEIYIRKKLGEQLTPIITQYLDQGKPLDSNFLIHAYEFMK
jgi:hypothetical protein